MFLNRIIATKMKEVELLKQTKTIQQMAKEIAQLPACRGFEKALTANANRGMGLIAEVKKASPSKGLIRADFDPVAIAKAYETAGADCISVLTDREYFQGSEAYLRQVSDAVHLPLLRKDFTVDLIQIYEARLMKADAILLIAAILTVEQMQEFIQTARDLGLDILVEVHNQEELERVLQLETTLIGINNRNLHTFETDLKTTALLTKIIPQGITIVSESGISNRREIDFLKSAGANAVLVGEHFMRQSSVEQAVNDLMGPAAAKGVR